MPSRRQTVIDQRGYIFLFPSLGLPNLNPKGEFHLIRVAIGTEAQAKRLLYDSKVEAPRRYACDRYALFDIVYEGAVWIMPLVAAEKDPSQTEIFTLLVQRIHPQIVPEPGRNRLPDGHAIFTLFQPEGLASFQPPWPPEIAKLAAKTPKIPTEADENAFWEDDEMTKDIMTSENPYKEPAPNTETMEAPGGKLYMTSRAGRRQRKRAEEQEKKKAEPARKTDEQEKKSKEQDKEQTKKKKAPQEREEQPHQGEVQLTKEQIKTIGEQLKKKYEQQQQPKRSNASKETPAPLADWPCPPDDAFDEVWQLEARAQAMQLALYLPEGCSGTPTLGITLRARTSEDAVRFEYAVTYGSEPAQEWQWLPLPKRAWKPGCELRFTNQVRKGLGMKLCTQEELVGE